MARDRRRPDEAGQPSVGRERTYVATGHGRMGITLGPVTGRLLAAVILEGAEPRELEPFRIERFRR